ncbi:hypothetical protein [Elstera litoralis]|uniref:hypothetical protein n=1 Tax=Elstera litoralis TaxID=552518 RepID=UPI0012EDBCF0|nr:hypothetical protein [Elstera litoralis]
MPTLTKCFRDELSQGLEKANALVAQSLFQSALAGNNTAQIFWLKTRAGWREKPQQHEHSGPGGTLTEQCARILHGPTRPKRPLFSGNKKALQTNGLKALKWCCRRGLNS